VRSGAMGAYVCLPIDNANIERDSCMLVCVFLQLFECWLYVRLVIWWVSTVRAKRPLGDNADIITHSCMLVWVFELVFEFWFHF